MASSSSPVGEFPRYAVITLQGGGVYGLTLLGQLMALLERFHVWPVAISGSSAGAIVAALYWAGLSPREILEEFAALAAQKDENGDSRLMALLGPFRSSQHPEEAPLDFRFLREFERKFSRHWSDFKENSGVLRDEENSTVFTTLHAIWFVIRMWRFIPPLLLAVRKLGLFAGDRLEQELDRMLKRSPRFKALAAEIGDQQVCFKHARLLVERGDAFFPALFITATNLTTGQLELISSLDAAYDDMPVARAARASGSFPIVLRPAQHRREPTDVVHRFVDGGLISNFPVWIYGQNFRSLLTPNKFGHVRQIPYLHVGLRRQSQVGGGLVSEEISQFLGAFAGMLSGGARDELEERLATNVRPSVIIGQPLQTTGGPPKVMDVDQMDENRVRHMVNQGFQHVMKNVPDLDFRYPSRPEDLGYIQHLLEELVRHVAKAVSSQPNQSAIVRAAVYLPERDVLAPTPGGTPGIDLRLVYQSNFDAGDPDRDLVIASDEGLIGQVFQDAGPAVLSAPQGLHLVTFGAEDPGRYPIRADRKWLMGVPIEDPSRATWNSNEDDPHESERLVPVVYGVLAIDSDWVPPDGVSGTSPRISDVGANVQLLMQATAMELGELFRDRFGRLVDVKVTS